MDICWTRARAVYNGLGAIEFAHDWRDSLAPGVQICGACGALRNDPDDDTAAHVADDLASERGE